MNKNESRPARKKLTDKLTKLGYKCIWQEKGGRYTFTFYLRNESTEIGSPFKQVLIQDFEGKNGFEVYVPATGSNDVNTTIESIEEYTNANQKRLKE